MRSRRGSGRGAASVVVVACVAVLLVVGCGLTVVAATVVDHRRAQLAADLAALAGAAGARGGGQPAAPRQVGSRPPTARASTTAGSTGVTWWCG